MSARVRRELESNPSRRSATIKKLVVFKEKSSGEIKERRVALYFFIIGNNGGMNPRVRCGRIGTSVK